MFSAFLSLGSAAIYGLSAAGTMWRMKVAAGWELFSKEQEQTNPAYIVFLEGIAILWYDAIFIFAPLPLLCSIAMFIFMEASLVIRVLLGVAAGFCALPWVFRLLLAIRSLWGNSKEIDYKELVDITALPEILAHHRHVARLARNAAAKR
jgi:hypothetical protein